MFAPKFRIIAGIALFACFTCSYPGRQIPKSDRTLVDWGTGKSAQPAKAPEPVAPRKTYGRQKTFLDSVLVKMNLSFRQITQHTNLYTFYYKEHVKFSGDTVWFRNGKRPLAVIRYDDRGLSKKFLLVFNKHGECTSSLMVGMDGDLDGGFDSIVLNYKVLSSSTFSTTETWTHREGEKNDKVMVTEQFYWIDNKGAIMAQNNTIHSFTRPREQANAQ